MGNRASRDECRGSATAVAVPRRLSERDALRVATAWHKALRGTVYLDTNVPIHWYMTEAKKQISAHVSTDMEIVPRFEYVCFDFACFESVAKRENAMRAARAAVLAWRAVSLCVGFSGTENPIFWKRVFSALLGPTTSAPLEINDSVAFFDHPDRPFPRVCFRWLDHLPLHLMWDAVSFDSHDQKLQSVLQELKPFLPLETSERRIPVAVSATYDAVGLGKTLIEINALQQAKSDQSAFQLTTVIHPQHQYQSFTQGVPVYGARTNVQIVTLSADESCDRIAPSMSSLLAQQRRGQAPMWLTEVRTLRLWPHSPHVGSYAEPRYAQQFIAWCSALPHLANVTGLSITTDAHWVRLNPLSALVAVGEPIQLDATTAAWLGYAIFHPDAAQDGFSAENLTLAISTSNRFDVEALRRMRVGNNLLGPATTVIGYRQVRVRAGTVVRFVSPFNDGYALWTCTEECWLTACGEEEPNNPRVLVVLPGHGISWIQRQDITEVRSRAAAPSCVRRLRLYIPQRHEVQGRMSTDTEALVVELVSILGDRLVYIHLDTCSTVSSSTVQSILSHCPNLQSLRLCHDGSYWARTERQGPRLQELDLTIDDLLAPLTSPQLDGLRALRIRGFEFSLNRDAVLGVLDRALDLAYFHWQLSYPTTKRATQSYDRGRQATRAWLTSEAETGRVPFRLDARRAFLSVLRHKNLRSSAMTRLPQDALVVTFSFSSSFAPRQLHIEQSSSISRR